MAPRHTQRERLLAVLIDARGAWVPLPTILDLRISQYSARIAELRGLNFNIENRIEVKDGVRHSFFRLTKESQPANPRPAAPTPAPISEPVISETLFDLGGGHRDDN